VTSLLLNKVLAAPGPDEAWFEGLLRWVLEGDPAGGMNSPRSRRLWELTARFLDDDEGPAWRARVQAVWGHTSAVGLLADAGLPTHGAFIREAMALLADRIIPSLDPESDLSSLLHRLDLEEADADWVLALPAGRGLWDGLLSVPEEACWDAVQLLAIRAAALGLARDLLGLGPTERELDSPFARLPEAARILREGGDPAWAALLEACRARLKVALSHLEVHGISTELVYRLDLLEAHLGRMGELVSVLLGRGDGRVFAAELIRRKARGRRLGTLVKGSLRLMARKVVEHTGHTGEHCIAVTRTEWLGTFRSAAGGGALTAFTALFKYALAGAALAPLVAGAAFAANYTASFVAMQFLGFTLASKQPAMTAASLAGALEDSHSRDKLRSLVAGITRSQVMATLGNVLVTIPATLLLALAWRFATGKPFVEPHTALHSLQGLHPFHSWTIPFAALTGVLLWLASLAAGWAANWSAFNRFPEAVAGHRRLVYFLGPARAEQLGRLVERHFSGVAGYVALGFLLGFLPVAAAFCGLPIEVRHVTLNAATLVLCAVQDAPHWREIAWALSGILVIGACNFGVSFYLALRTAMRARGIAGGDKVLAWLRREFLRAPWTFLGPPHGEDP